VHRIVKVAVVIPCHNVEHHVEAALRSVLVQTHNDLDVVAVDDGSTDGTGAVLQCLAAAFPARFRIITQPNRGGCAARNTGLKATEGAYVQFLDADDVLLPDKIAGQVALAQRERAPALIVGGYRNVYPDGSSKEIRPHVEDAWMALVRTRLGTTTADLWRREDLLRVGGWDEQLASSQDYELAFRLLRTGGRVVWDDRITAEVLKRERGSISRTNELNNWERYIDLRVAVREHLRTSGLPNTAAIIAECDQYLFRALRVIGRTDPTQAAALFDRVMPAGFVPQAGEALSATYVALYRLLGFRGAERAVAALGNLRRLFGRR
jgi:glycosyltransferase involved in cell wall biosynthesis